MQRLMLLGVAATALLAVGAAGPVTAADMAPVYKAASVVAPLPASWTGFYFGAHVGGGWGTKEFNGIEGEGVSSNINLSSFNINGPLGGVQAGYNFQSGWVVFGIDGDFSWARINGNGNFQTFCETACAFSADARWLATLTGRIGGTVDHALLYVKGGIAWVNDKFILASTNLDESSNSLSSSKTRTGWVLGGGVEYAFTRNWSGKLEYDFMDFGTKDATFCDEEGDCASIPVRQRIHAVKAGLNYRFDWGR